MSESLRSNSESSRNEQENNLEVTELAMSGLSRVIREQDDDADNHNVKDGHYYSEYEDRHYGEERVDFDEEKMTLQEIPLTMEILQRYSFLGELPHGIAVMGGIARSVAREIITGEREPIRDIDLVNITNEEGDSEVDHETLTALSRKFMPGDYAFGHGIGSDTMNHYFETRDFTINQCLIADGKLIISDLAYNDFCENIIRPTYFEHPYDGDDISGRLFLKALMMRSVLSQISDSIPLIEDMEQPGYISPFNIALFLNKAMSRGAETAHIFTNDLADWGIIPEDYADYPVALAKVLLGNVYSFEFRPSTDERFMEIQECKDLNGFFIPSVMLRYHASNPTIRHLIEEYEDGSSETTTIEEERVSGYYTQAEYDEINRFSTDRQL